MREQGERRTKSYEEVLVIKLQEAMGVHCSIVDKKASHYKSH